MSTSSGSIKRQQTLYVPQDIYINNNKAWHAGNLAKSEFAPSSHVGLGGSEHAAVTTTVNGFMIAADKVRLNGMSDGANKVAYSSTNGNIKIDGTETVVYTHPTGDGNLHVPATGTTNNTRVLKAGSTAGSITWGQVAFSEVSGTITDTQHGARGGDTLHAAVTQTVNGFMIASDKLKLDNIQSNAINQTTADGRYLQLTGGTLSNTLTISQIGDAKLVLNADTDNDTAEGGEAKIVLTQDGGIVGVEIKTTQGGTSDNTLTIAPYMDYNTATPTKNYNVFIHDKKIWHEGSLAKSEFTPASHVGTGGTSHAAVTTTANGFMIFGDKVKMDGIATGATKVASSTNGNIKITDSTGTTTDTNVYTHPTTAGNIHLPAGGASGQWVKWSADGTGAWTAIDWSDVGNKPTSTVTNIDDAVTKRHTQNTDTGTTSTSFTVASGALVSSGIKFGNASQPYIKWYNGSDANQTGATFEFHKVADTSFAEVKALTFKKNDGTEVSYSGHTHDYTTLTNIPASFNPVIASSTVLGGVKQGTNISIAVDGTISGAYVVATQSADGLQSLGDKKKLDGISTGATKAASSPTNGNIRIDGVETTVYTHPTTAGNVHLPSGGSTGQWIKWSAAGTGAWTSIDWSDIGSKPTSTVANIDAAVTAKHNQNTDTGTSSQVFTVNTTGDPVNSASGVSFGSGQKAYIRWSTTSFEAYKDYSATTKLWADITANTFKKSDGTEVSYVGHTHSYNNLTDLPAAYVLPVSTSSVLGGVKIGSNVSVDANGVISVAAPYVHPTGDGNKHVPADSGSNTNKVLKATATAGSPTWGSVDWGELTGKPTSYTPPIATSGALGGVKIGSNVSVDANGVISVAAPYTHPTGDGNKHVPADSGTNANKVLKATSTAGAPTWGSVDWTELSSKPTTFAPSAHTHAISDVTNLSSTLSDKASLSSANTFSYNGVAVKIQPSSSAGANAVLLQLNNSTGASLVTMGTNGTGETQAKVVINGDLEVTGATVQKSTQDIQGDMNVTGNLNVTGNATLGDSTADQTTVKGDLRLEGNLLPIGRYLEVARLPIFGIADDFQFETDATTFQDLISHFSTFDTLGGSVFEAPNSGSTRYYRLMVSYSSSGTDDSTLRIIQEGTTTEVVSFALPAVNGSSDANFGLGSKARSWMSTHFSTTYTGSTTFQAKKNISGSVAIRYIEIIAYDYYA